MKHLYLLIALGILAISWQVSTSRSNASGPTQTQNKPNVLFIAVDDLNHWVGHLGRNPQTRTPNIDRLARMGVTFTRAYCAAPVCNPSRAALMSGLRPGATGIYDNGQDWKPVIPEAKTLTTQFRNAGYFVAGAGKIYHANAHRPGEWDDYLEREGGEPLKLHPSAKDRGVDGIAFAPLDNDDSALPDYKIVSYGIEQLQKKHDRPFFLAIGLHKPHMPWNVPKKYFDMHPLDKIELPPYQDDDLSDVPAGGIRMAKPEGDHAAILESGRWKDAVQGYLAAISFCDTMIGRLLEAFEQSAYKNNTIIVFWGDHGWHLGEKRHWRKFALWEEATRAPMIWVVPGVTRPGGKCARTVDFMSIYPTLCDLAGIPIPQHVQGPSIKPLLRDPKAALAQPAITTFHQNNHAVRTEGWRYIRYADGGEELYDETRDPHEWRNLAGDARFADRKVELTKLLPTQNAPELPRSMGKGKGKGKRGNGKMNKAIVALAVLTSLAGADLQVADAAQASVTQNQGSGAGYRMLEDLEEKAKLALRGGDTKAATRYASELLKKNTDKTSWNYGNVIYEAHQILGLAALKEGRVPAAKKYLIAAGKTPGSPQLDSFGPEMTLAQELLKKGEKQVVLEFLDLVAKFWATPKKGMEPFAGLYEEHAAKIKGWKAVIRSGKQPTLNRVGLPGPSSKGATR